ncbi:hypothetical protein [Marinobacter salsuginis]|uniref:Uncharacterized protein n=1 Tax=Marinobacter salsuginis TaxID=418719 RepID=A0A5M3Q1V2_9GAMM|nr:hypothetical protein [Marinobacter salsuginis]GBO89198.1 hypothetical protein MSSD14B_28660 [Marinobacter salsuginis]
MKQRHTKESLERRASRLEDKIERLSKADPDANHWEIQHCYEEAGRLREWAEHGCLIGNPTSTWRP